MVIEGNDFIDAMNDRVPAMNDLMGAKNDLVAAKDSRARQRRFVRRKRAHIAPGVLVAFQHGRPSPSSSALHER